MERWRRIAPDLGALALLVHHAAGELGGEGFDKEGTLPAYQLLCTTFPTAQRSPICNTIGVLRSGSGDLRAAAENALGQFVDTARGILQVEMARQQQGAQKP